MRWHELRFSGMGTEIELRAFGPGTTASLLEREANRLRLVEASLSRFRPDSELSRLNAVAGRPVIVSPLTADVIRAAVDAAKETGGLFDPTLLGELESAGYDRSWEEICDSARGLARGLANDPPAMHRSGAGVAPATGRWRDLRVDARHRFVEAPPGVRIDLGGIAKGWAVDRAWETLAALPAACVNAGGDLRAHAGDPVAAEGAPPAWEVEVEDPLGGGVPVGRLRLRRGAVATSSVMRRRWAAGHHLIDPRTGRPAETDLASVTVAAATAAEAEVRAKCALILGRRSGRSFLAARPVTAAVLVGVDGAVEVLRRRGDVAGADVEAIA